MIAAILLAAAAPAGVTLHCVGTRDSDDGKGSPVAFDLSFTQRGAAVRNIVFAQDGPGAFGKWRGKLRDGTIKLSISEPGSTAGMTVHLAGSDGRYDVSWDSTYGGGCIWFIDTGKASCTSVSGNPLFEASAT